MRFCDTFVELGSLHEYIEKELCRLLNTGYLNDHGLLQFFPLVLINAKNPSLSENLFLGPSLAYPTVLHFGGIISMLPHLAEQVRLDVAHQVRGRPVPLAPARRLLFRLRVNSGNLLVQIRNLVHQSHSLLRCLVAVHVELRLNVVYGIQKGGLVV